MGTTMRSLPEKGLIISHDRLIFFRDHSRDSSEVFGAGLAKPAWDHGWLDNH